MRQQHLPRLARRGAGLLVGAGVVALMGCVSPLTVSSGPSPADIPRLEAELRADSSSVPALVELASAYRAAGRQAEARDLLDRAVGIDPAASDAVLLLGLTHEELGDYASARESYESYLAVGESAEVKGDLRQRIILMRRRELEVAIRNSVAAEDTLGVEPEARTVAVFPFRMISPDSTLAPLGRALAEMLVTDLSQTNRLRVLERLRVQVLLDELELAASGLTDPATAARGGRLLRAERVVQGSIDGGREQVLMDAAVVLTRGTGYTGAQPVGTPGGAAQPPALGADAAIVSVSEAGTLEGVFDMEKQLALDIYQAMGIELTAAEREQVNQRPTENLQALLAYGRGLEASDAGDFERALEHFSTAASLDAGFLQASQQAAAVEAMAGAVRLSTGEVARKEAGPGSSDALAGTDALVPDPSGRDAASELLGTEGLSSGRTTIDLIIRRPTGGE